MNRHVGASFSLSVLLVSFFAVILYQPDPRKPASKKADPAARAAHTAAHPPAVEGSAHGDLPAETTAVSDATERPNSPRPSTIRSPMAPSVARATRGPTSSETVATTRPVSRQTATLRPRSSFTEVIEGETLTDVALRVYGTADASRTLWLANRDVIDRTATPLHAGVMLRTP